MSELSVPPPSERLLSSVAQARPVSTRSPRRQLAILMVVSAGSVALALAVLGVRGDLGALPRPWLAMMAGAWLAAHLALAWTVLFPPRGQMMPRAKLAGVGGVGAFLVMATLALSWTERAPGSEPVAAGFLAFVEQALPCIAGGLMVASSGLVLAMVFVRHAAPLRPRWLAAGAGAHAGALGGLALQFHCAVGDGAHVAFAHAAVIVLAAAIACGIATVLRRYW